MLFRFCHAAMDGFSYQLNVGLMKDIPILIYILLVWFSIKVLLQFISMAFSLDLLFNFGRSGVDVLAGFGANVGFVSSELCV